MLAPTLLMSGEYNFENVRVSNRCVYGDVKLNVEGELDVDFIYGVHTNESEHPNEAQAGCSEFLPSDTLLAPQVPHHQIKAARRHETSGASNVNVYFSAPSVKDSNGLHSGNFAYWSPDDVALDVVAFANGATGDRGGDGGNISVAAGGLQHGNDAHLRASGTGGDVFGAPSASTTFHPRRIKFKALIRRTSNSAVEPLGRIAFTPFASRPAARRFWASRAAVGELKTLSLLAQGSIAFVPCPV